MKQWYRFCIVLLAAVALFGFANYAAYAKSPPYEDNYGGIWRTDWEDVMFSMDYDGLVTGAFGAGKAGRLGGVIRVETLYGVWAADQGETPCSEERWGSRYWGDVVMVFDYGGNGLSGKWGACGESPSTAFSGRRLKMLDMNAAIHIPSGKPVPSLDPDSVAVPAAPGSDYVDAAPGIGGPEGTVPADPDQAVAADVGPAEPPSDFPTLPQPAPVQSALTDPAELLLPDTALDTVLNGEVWEIDALVDKEPERYLSVGWPYRMAYASYLPLGKEQPMLDVRVYTGNDAALKIIEGTGRESLRDARDCGIVEGAFKGTEYGRFVLWFRHNGAALRLSGPDEPLVQKLARILLDRS